MIVHIVGRIPGAPPDGPEEGYLALHSSDSGEWMPVTGEYVSTADEAVRQCRADVCNQLDDIEHALYRRIDVVRDCVIQLWQRPATTDDIRIGGIVYRADEDGTVTVPLARAPEDSDEHELDSDDTVVERLRDVLTSEQEASPAGELADLVRAEPLRFLAGMHARYPELLGDLAEFMVEVDRAHAGQDSDE